MRSYQWLLAFLVVGLLFWTACSRRPPPTGQEAPKAGNDATKEKANAEPFSGSSGTVKYTKVWKGSGTSIFAPTGSMAIYLSKTDGWPLAEEVYIAATKNPRLTTLSIELAMDFPESIFDKYGKDLKGRQILGTIAVNGLDDIRRYKDEALYAQSNWTGYAEKVQNLCLQWECANGSPYVDPEVEKLRQEMGRQLLQREAHYRQRGAGAKAAAKDAREHLPSAQESVQADTTQNTANWEGKVVQGDVRNNVYFIHKGIRYYVAKWEYVTPFGLWGDSRMLKVKQGEIDALPEGHVIDSVDEMRRCLAR